MLISGQELLQEANGDVHRVLGVGAKFADPVQGQLHKLISDVALVCVPKLQNFNQTRQGQLLGPLTRADARICCNIPEYHQVKVLVILIYLCLLGLSTVATLASSQ